MKSRDFFVQIPGLCGCKNADRWADLIGYMYDRELEGGTVFDRNDRDREDPENRIECAFAFKAKDEGAKEQCKRLVKIILLSHYIEEHGETHYDYEVSELLKEATEKEKQYPEIAMAMPAVDALAGYWAD